MLRVWCMCWPAWMLILRFLGVSPFKYVSAWVHYEGAHENLRNACECGYGCECQRVWVSIYPFRIEFGALSPNSFLQTHLLVEFNLVVIPERYVLGSRRRVVIVDKVQVHRAAGGLLMAVLASRRTEIRRLLRTVTRLAMCSICIEWLWTKTCCLCTVKNEKPL